MYSARMSSERPRLSVSRARLASSEAISRLGTTISVKRNTTPSGGCAPSVLPAGSFARQKSAAPPPPREGPGGFPTLQPGQRFDFETISPRGLEKRPASLEFLHDGGRLGIEQSRNLLVAPPRRDL